MSKTIYNYNNMNMYKVLGNHNTHTLDIHTIDKLTL